VGIDLELVSTLPDATDYREHEFYRENFAPEEISHCLLQTDAKTSLCGLWAAKEAVAKALGMGTVRESGLRSIAIRHDESGRPWYEVGELSISHSGGFCVAVFIVLA
jgi:phosphopantetheine--protein transferase-like protein